MTPRYARRVIQIRAVDSPSVQRAIQQQAAGQEPDGQAVIPGVLTWQEYIQRRATWDSIRQCIGLDAQFYEGADALMFPPLWLENAEHVADRLRLEKITRKALAIGVDPGEGSANTAFVVVDHKGVIELVTKPTLDTTVITSEAIALFRKHGVPPDRVVFDRGGGGKQHADRLRQQGHNVQTVAFGESLNPPPRQQLHRPPFDIRIDDRESRYAYKNRRAEMYGILRQIMDPSEGEVLGVTGVKIKSGDWGIPAWYPQFRQQLAPIPLLYDPEGRLELLPKHRKADARGAGMFSTTATERRTLVELIGHSPDEADALVLAIYGMLRLAGKARAGVV